MIPDDIERLKNRNGELTEAVSILFGLIADGFLVRDTSHDNEPGWAVKALPSIVALGKAYKLAGMEVK